jgi:hypothetical protein
MLETAGYDRFGAGKLIKSLSQGFYPDDSISDDLWTLRGGAEVHGAAFKASIILSLLAVITGFMLLPSLSGISGAIGYTDWRTIVFGAQVSLGSLGFLYIARYILRVVSSRY